MLNLVTNLNTSLGPVLRDELDENFKKIETGIGDAEYNSSKAVGVANNASDMSNDTKKD